MSSVVRSCTVVLGVSGLVASAASADLVQIRNSSQLPNWNQHHDFSAAYANQPSDIFNGAAQLNFNQLAGTVGAGGSRTALANAGAAGYSWTPGPLPMGAVPFSNGYYNAMTRGDLHCVPTASGMWMEWLRQNKFSQLNAQTEVAGITNFAQMMDTNDQNPGLHTGDNFGHFGTYYADAVTAANQFSNDSSWWYRNVSGPTFKRWDYTKEGYKKLIDANSPPVVFYNNAGTNIGHAVVGWGYDNAMDGGMGAARVADPWDGSDKWKNFSSITNGWGGGGTRTYGGIDAPQVADFNADWTDVGMVTAEKADFGDAPSSYESGHPAFHAVSRCEWLGAHVSGETGRGDTADPFNPGYNFDDDDGHTNVNGGDGYDDGVRFHWDPAGANHTFDVQISTSDFFIDPRYDAADPAKQLYLSGWFDFNGDMQWTPDELVAFGAYAPMAGDSLLESFNLAIPDSAPDHYWARFRLSYGEAVGPTGYTEWGEVEDYLVPTPGTFALMGLGGLLVARRRRVTA